MRTSSFILALFGLALSAAAVAKTVSLMHEAARVFEIRADAGGSARSHGHFFEGD